MVGSFCFCAVGFMRLFPTRKREQRHRTINPGVFLYITMENVSSDAAIGDNTGLAAQVLADDAAAYEAAVSNTKQGAGNEATSSAKAGDGEGKGQDSVEDVPTEDNGQVEEETETEPEGEQPEAKESEEPKTETKPAPLKIGSKEFATPEAAVREATRILGRNGELAGRINALEAEMQQATTSNAELAAQLKEALRVNQEWKEWHEASEKGQNKAAPREQQPSVEDTVRKVMSEQREAQKADEWRSYVVKEHEEIQALDNYADVSQILFQLSDKVNPFTGKYYMPKEAYAAACQHLGIPNLLANKPAANKPASSTPPKPIADPARKQAAARLHPTSRRSALAENADKEVDDVLSGAFPTY